MDFKWHFIRFCHGVVATTKPAHVSPIVEVKEAFETAAKIEELPVQTACSAPSPVL